MTPVVLLVLATSVLPPRSAPQGPRAVADPAYARDGRLAVSIAGDLWVRGPGDSAAWVQLTSGPAADREPAWTPDGAALVFTSNRAGTFHLWRIGVGAAGATDTPQRVDTSAAWEGEPTIAPNGDLVFARAMDGETRLMLRDVAGGERLLLAQHDGAEHWPAYAPDGRRIAYVTNGERGSALRIRWLEGDSTTVVFAQRAAERPAWSPLGDRLVFAERRGSPGTWVAPPEGGYANLVSAHAAAAAWSPDGASLALAELPPADVGYNGDPDRVGNRELVDLYPGVGRLWFLPAPAPPDAGLWAAAPAPGTRAAGNGEVFDRAWERTARVYYGGEAAPRRARWQALREVYRPRALAARSEDQLESVLHEMWLRRPPLRRAAIGRAAVSSAHPVATAAGLEMLRMGGNVVDAAVAVSFALGVVEPDASGVGGYGQMLIQLSQLTSPALIEFMTRAPEDAGLANGTLRQDGDYPDDGPVLPNVPGTVAGIYLAWQRYGSHRIPWADLLAPAIRAAEQGYVVSDGLATTLQVERRHFLKYPGSRALFFPGGAPLQAGDTLRNPDLARTLRAIADSGAAAFYRGAIARRIVEDLRGHGNAMRLTDLERYYAVPREPVSGTYRGYTIFSSTPPVAGGATLIAQLNGLGHIAHPAPYPDDAATLHAMIEAWKLVPSTRGRIADPGLWPVHPEAFLDPDSATARWRCYRADRALTPADLRDDSLPCAADGPAAARRGADEAAAAAAPCRDADRVGAHCHQSGTTAFVVADADGNVVAATQTLGTWGGNFYVTPGLGFLYNDKLTSYGDDPDAYGARLPNARHGSSIAPTIVFRGTGAQRRPVLGVGAAGNAWITSAVYAIVTGVIDQQLDVQHALELPRFLLSQRRASGAAAFTVQLEAGVAPAVRDRLTRLGDDVQLVSLPGELRMGYAAAVALGAQTVTAGADPRRAGSAGAVGCGPGETGNCQVDTYPR